MRFFLLVIVLLSFSHCNRIEQDDPFKVIEQYSKLRFIEKDYSESYALFSDTCKKFASLNEYKEALKADSTKYEILSITPVDIGISDKYRRYEVKLKAIENTDTTFKYSYYTLSRKDKIWSVVVLRNIGQVIVDGAINSEIIPGLKEQLKIDPYDGEAIAILAAYENGINEKYEPKDEIAKALRFSPNDVSVLLSISWIYQTLEKNREYISIINKAASLNSFGQDVFNTLIGTYYFDKIKDTSTAISYFHKSISFNDKDGEPYWYLATAYEKANPDSAQFYYQKAHPIIENYKQEAFLVSYLFFLEDAIMAKGRQDDINNAYQLIKQLSSIAPDKDYQTSEKKRIEKAISYYNKSDGKISVLNK